MLRAFLALFLLLPAAPLLAQSAAQSNRQSIGQSAGEASAQTPAPTTAQQRAVQARLQLEKLNAANPQLDASLNAVRSSFIECEDGCLTPAEAAAFAFSNGENGQGEGRFLLEVRGGGQSLQGNLGELFFVSSHQNYAEFGTLTIAFEAKVLNDLLRRARTCEGELLNGEITVKGCRQQGISGVNMFTMMQRLFKRRIVVTGEIKLQWIDAQAGLRRPTSNKRGEFEKGYFQPWVQVEDADQIVFAYAD